MTTSGKWPVTPRPGEGEVWGATRLLNCLQGRLKCETSLVNFLRRLDVPRKQYGAIICDSSSKLRACLVTERSSHFRPGYTHCNTITCLQHKRGGNCRLHFPPTTLNSFTFTLYCVLNDFYLPFSTFPTKH